MIYKRRRCLFILLHVTILSAMVGCAHRNVRVPALDAASRNDNSYMDLEPGWRLRVVVPLLKSGGFRVATEPEQSDSNTITASAADLIGYQTAYYAIKGKGSRGVQLEFASGETTTAGKTVPQQSRPILPFEFPLGAEHIRLIYFVRVSQSDHNMAIVAAKRINSLKAFSAQLKAKPAACVSNKEIFCTWVPAGIAVRPEKL